MAKDLWYIFGGSWLMGIFLAIYIITGTNVEPNDLIFNVLDTMVQAFVQTFQTMGVNISLLNTTWSIVKIVFLIIGIIVTIRGILQTLSRGWTGIIVALSGFFGWLLLLLGGGHVGLIIFGLILLVTGIGICSAFEGDAPEDFIRID